MKSEKIYKLHAASVTDSIYAACMGQDLKITDILDDLDISPEEQAAEVAARLTETLYHFGSTAERCRPWIYDAALYLLTACEEKDCTFREMITLMNVEKRVRDFLFTRLEDRKAYGNPPKLLQELDLALIRLLIRRNMMARADEIFSRAAQLAD